MNPQVSYNEADKFRSEFFIRFMFLEFMIPRFPCGKMVNSQFLHSKANLLILGAEAHRLRRKIFTC